MLKLNKNPAGDFGIKGRVPRCRKILLRSAQCTNRRPWNYFRGEKDSAHIQKGILSATPFSIKLLKT